MLGYIGTAMTGIKGAIEITKGINAVKELTNNAEVKMKIAELMQSLANVTGDLARFQMEMIDKETLVKELQEKLKTKEAIYYQEPFYWKILGDEKKDGPYCQKCYDADNKLVRLLNKKNRISGSHHCSVCDEWYGQGTPSKSISARRSRWDI